MKLKISYESEEELAHLLNFLDVDIHRVKKQPAKGKYQRAYLDYQISGNPEK